MTHGATLDLPDGRQLEYRIRPSDRAKALRLKISLRDGLTVITPKGIEDERVQRLVSSRADWIAAKLDQFDEVRHLVQTQTPAPPEAFRLAATGETWIVEYHATRAKTVGATTDCQGRIMVCGNISDAEACKAALRRWLARRAKEAFIPLVKSLAKTHRVKVSRITLRHQRTRWGSCSAGGVISLNAKLLFVPPDLVRYVILHELAHTRHPNHSKKFWALVRQFDPDMNAHHGSMRDAWKCVPGWANQAGTRASAM